MNTELGARNAQILEMYLTQKIDLEGYRERTCHIYKVDITSLYPSACSNVEYECEVLPVASKWRILVTKARPDPTALHCFSAMAESRRKELVTCKPINKYWMAFPNPTKGWLTHDFKGIEMTDTEYVQLKTMCGCIEITFDQSQAPWPTLLKKMECKAFGTLAPVIHGTETYTVPQVLQAYDSGTKIWLGEVLYTTETWNPFENYMNIFKGVENDADAIKNRLEALDNPTPEQEDELKEAGFDRTVAKLMLNGLLGRMNMKIDRKQHVLTKGSDDVVRAIFNPDHYRGFDCSIIKCGETELHKMKFS